MARWIAAARLADCPVGEAIEVVAGDRMVALFNVGGTIHALDGVCPHQGGPLGQGKLDGTTITCPWHGWQFDVCTGQHRVSRTMRQPCLPVRIEGDQILVDVESSDG